MRLMVLMLVVMITVMLMLLWTAVHVSAQQDGGDAATQHVLDRGAVPEEGGGRAVSVSPDPHVHLRLRFLPLQEQPVHHL